MRFTVDGSQVLEKRIAEDMAAIRKEVLARIENHELTALVLGGGYGRGEGGVYVKGGKERVYNDYDLFVIVPNNSRRRHRRLADALAEVKAVVEPECGIHVDFSPAMPRASLSTLPYELMFMELKAGYHVVIGPENILADLPHYDTAHPPMEEIARLLMNRGVGLLLARHKLEQIEVLAEEEREFVVRNIRKAQLAMGDTLLALRGRYSPSYIERLTHFRSIDLDDSPIGETLRTYYEEAMDFKLRPKHPATAEDSLMNWHARITMDFERIFLWFESIRLEEPELTWLGYQNRPCRLAQRGALESAKNLLRNLTIKASALPAGRELWLHPRDRVLAHLPSLLFGRKDSKRQTEDLLRLWKYCG